MEILQSGALEEPPQTSKGIAALQKSPPYLYIILQTAHPIARNDLSRSRLGTRYPIDLLLSRILPTLFPLSCRLLIFTNPHHRIISTNLNLPIW